MADPWPYADDTTVTGAIYYNSTSTTSGNNTAYKVVPRPEDEHAEDRSRAKQANKMLSYRLDRQKQVLVAVVTRRRIIRQPKPRSEFVAYRYR